MISGLLAPQVLAESEIPSDIETVDAANTTDSVDPAAETSPVITIGRASEDGLGLDTVTSVPSTVFPAGTYRLKALDSSTTGIAYVLSYPSDNYDVVEDYTYVNDTAAITVKDGQYLQLSDCIIAGTAPASSATANHGLDTDSQYDGRSDASERASGDEQRTSLITAGSLIPGLPTMTSSPSTVYQPGTYLGGTDIPAGTYYFEPTGLYGFAYILSAPSRQYQDVEEYENVSAYNGTATLTIQDGQYLFLTGCVLASNDEATRSPGPGGSNEDMGPGGSNEDDGDRIPDDSSSRVITAPEKGRTLSAVTSTTATVYPEGTYQAGADIPTGEYVLFSSGASDSPASSDSSYAYGGTYVISTTADIVNFDDIVDYEDITESFIVRDGEDTVVTVRDGQYLQLLSCVVTKKITSDGSSSGPAFAPEEDAPEEDAPE